MTEYVYEDTEGGYILSVYSNGVLYEIDYCNEQDKIEKQITYQEDGTQTVTAYKYVYDDNENIIEVQTRNVLSEKQYEYNTDNQLIKMIADEINGSSVETLYTYDANGNVIKEETEDTVITYEYDEEGKRISGEFKKGTETGEYTYEYGSNNELVKETLSTSIGRFITKEYEYDEEGNMVKEFYKETENGTTIEIMENKYTYKILE